MAKKHYPFPFLAAYFQSSLEQ